MWLRIHERLLDALGRRERIDASLGMVDRACSQWLSRRTRSQRVTTPLPAMNYSVLLSAVRCLTCATCS